MSVWLAAVSTGRTPETQGDWELENPIVDDDHNELCVSAKE